MQVDDEVVIIVPVIQIFHEEYDDYEAEVMDDIISMSDEVLFEVIE